MLISRQYEVYLCICEDQMYISWERKSDLAFRDFAFEIASACYLDRQARSPLSRHFHSLDETLHGSASIYMHNLPDGHVVMLSVLSTLLIGFAKSIASSH